MILFLTPTTPKNCISDPKRLAGSVMVSVAEVQAPGGQVKVSTILYSEGEVEQGRQGRHTGLRKVTACEVKLSP